MTESENKVEKTKDLDDKNLQIELEWKKHLKQKVESIVGEDRLKSTSLRAVYEEENEIVAPQQEEKQIEIGEEVITVPLSLDSVQNYGGKVIVSILFFYYLLFSVN